MSEAQIAILITAQNQAQAALERAQKAVAGLGTGATRSAAQHKRATDEMGKQNTSLHKGLELVNRRAETMFRTFESGTLGLNLVSLGLGGATAAAVGVGVAFNSTVQQAQLAFGVLLKGPGQAAAAIAALDALIGKVPLNIQALYQAGTRLTSAGFGDVPGLITTIADAISATGDISNDKLQSVVSSFVQLKSSGTFSMGVITDLTQAGIPVIRALAQQMGMTEFATSKMLESMSGKVPSDFLIPKIMDALKGLTGGLAAAEMNTLSGAVVKLQDNFSRFMGSLTGGVTATAQSAVGGLADMFDGLTESMKGWDPTLKKTLGFALLLGSAAAGVGGLGGSVPGLGALTGLLGAGGSTGGMIAIVVTLIGLIALLTPWGAVFEAIKTGVGDVWDATKDVAAKVGNAMLAGAGQGIAFAAAPIAASLVWSGELATRVGAWLAGAPLERALAVRAGWAAGVAGSIAAWLEAAPVERFLAVRAGWAAGILGSVASWLEAAPVERTLSVAFGWAKGIAGSVASWLEGAPIERTLSLGFAWAKGIVATVAGWLEGAPIERTLALGFAWGTGVLATVAGWLEGTGEIGRTLALGFRWGVGVLGSVQGWLEGGGIERTLALGFRWAEGVLASVQGWLEGGEVERTLALGFRWVEGVLATVQAWLEGGEVERTLALGFRWAEGVLLAVTAWLEGGEVERTLALGFTWAAGVLTAVQSWLEGGVIERTLSLAFAWAGGVLTEVGRWLQDPAAISRTLALGLAWVAGALDVLQPWLANPTLALARTLHLSLAWAGGGALDALQPWLANPTQTLARTVILNLTGGNTPDWIRNLLGGGGGSAPAATVPPGTVFGPPPPGVGSVGEGHAWYPDYPGGPPVEHHFASGGIAMGPTRALIGEAGPEAVIPLSRLSSVGGGEVHVHLYGNVYPNDIVDLVARGLDQARREARTG